MITRAIPATKMTVLRNTPIKVVEARTVASGHVIDYRSHYRTSRRAKV